MAHSLEIRNSTPIDSQKQTQLLATLQWIDENYEWSEGVCVPRCVLYQHYQDFCSKQGFVCIGAATFGKVIRQRFSKVTTRRLGTRGQSRYHYYGIGIKKTSLYYKQAYTGKGLSRFSGVQVKTDSSSKKYSLSSRHGTLLPTFPNFEDVVATTNLDEIKAKTFLVMYRAHCQRILDAVIVANFDEIHKFLLHFWQGMPAHLRESLKSEVVTRIVAACDVLLYKVINDVLIPPNIQDVPESLYQDIHSFICHLLIWLQESLEGCPTFLKSSKLEVASWFKILMKRQLSFIKLAQTARAIVSNTEVTRQMTKDLCTLDLSSTVRELADFLRLKSSSLISQIHNYYQNFVMLLLKQSPLEDYMEWLDEVIDNFLTEISKHEASSSSGSISDNGQSVTKTAARFVLIWSYFGSLITRDLTLQNASSFETQRMRQKSKLLQKDMACWLKSGSTFDVNSIALELEVVENQKSNLVPKDDGDITNIVGNYSANDNISSAIFKPKYDDDDVDVMNNQVQPFNIENMHCLQDGENNSEILSKDLKFDEFYQHGHEHQQTARSPIILINEELNPDSNITSQQINNSEMRSQCMESGSTSTSTFRLSSNSGLAETTTAELSSHCPNYTDCQMMTCSSAMEAIPFCRPQHPVLFNQNEMSRDVLGCNIPSVHKAELKESSFSHQCYL